MVNSEIKRQNVITETKIILVKKYLNRGFCIDDAHLKASSDLNKIFNKNKNNYDRNLNKT